MLGKAISENILIDVPLAPFFLNSLLNIPNNLYDLKSIDEELLKNLLFLKKYDDGDVSDLCINFSVTSSSYGVDTIIPLINNGNNTNTHTTLTLHSNTYIHIQIHRCLVWHCAIRLITLLVYVHVYTCVNVVFNIFVYVLYID
jgi:hypothetical protein